MGKTGRGEYKKNGQKRWEEMKEGPEAEPLLNYRKNRGKKEV